jgi:RsmE family RNA methyltransferase
MNLILLFPEDFVAPGRVRLQGRRLRHVREVHRAAVGDELCVGLEGGRIGRGRVLALDGDGLEMMVELETDPPPLLPVTLVLALPRPKMLKRILVTATSMGVKTIYLINSFRVEKSFWNSPLLSAEKLVEPLILGLEQARDTVLPQIYLHRLFKPFVEDELPAICAGTTALLAHPAGDAPCPRVPPGPVTLAIGPEGGFIPYEAEMLQGCGFSAVTLGERILRVETAVPVLLSRLAPL